MPKFSQDKIQISSSRLATGAWSRREGLRCVLLDCSSLSAFWSLKHFCDRIFGVAMLGHPYPLPSLTLGFDTRSFPPFLFFLFIEKQAYSNIFHIRITSAECMVHLMLAWRRFLAHILALLMSNPLYHPHLIGYA